MNQIAGAGAIFIDPENPEAAAQQIKSAWPHRHSLITQGVQNAARYSPEAALVSYLLVYKSISRP